MTKLTGNQIKELRKNRFKMWKENQETGKSNQENFKQIYARLGHLSQLLLQMAAMLDADTGVEGTDYLKLLMDYENENADKVMQVDELSKLI